MQPAIASSAAATAQQQHSSSSKKLTILPVRVPVLSKQAMLTSAADLSLAEMRTLMPLAFSLRAHAQLAAMMTVGPPMGTDATMVAKMLMATSAAGRLWWCRYGTAVIRKRQTWMHSTNP